MQSLDIADDTPLDASLRICSEEASQTEDFSDHSGEWEDEMNSSIHSASMASDHATPTRHGTSPIDPPSVVRISSSVSDANISTSDCSPHSSGNASARPSRHRKTLSLDHARALIGEKTTKIVDIFRKSGDQSQGQRAKDAATREQTVMSVKQIWESDMIPHFEERRSSKQLRELSWKGIPTKFRGKVWSLAIGNAMNITEELYQIMVKNARTTREAVDAAFRRGMSEEDIDAIFPGKMNSLSLIKLDLERTFPELCFFQQGTPEYDSLRDVLEAYVAYRPDMGYVQGKSNRLLKNEIVQTSSKIEALAIIMSKYAVLSFSISEPRFSMRICCMRPFYLNPTQTGMFSLL
eukprot:TRINITY_DN4907_c0_g1_i8.p1 TRINITY_DN4907_c0_g1~~TRINITY_DN4907_c0_g1_i8.p1  ORF type:complete len:350 (+),score=56.80 TRINITY_DN4907_c0_g1_i8:61-1110(+)